MNCKTENGKHHKVVKGILIAPAVAAGIFVFGYVVMHLWNAILPEIIGVHTVTFWQALGILVLSKILFGGFGGGHSHSKSHKNHRKEMREKWMTMTPEEKEKMKNEWWNRFEPKEKADDI